MCLKRRWQNLTRIFERRVKRDDYNYRIHWVFACSVIAYLNKIILYEYSRRWRVYVLTTINPGETRPVGRFDCAAWLRFFHYEIANNLVGHERKLRQVLFILDRVIPLFVVGQFVRYYEFFSEQITSRWWKKKIITFSLNKHAHKRSKIYNYPGTDLCVNA